MHIRFLGYGSEHPTPEASHHESGVSTFRPGDIHNVADAVADKLLRTPFFEHATQAEHEAQLQAQAGAKAADAPPTDTAATPPEATPTETTTPAQSTEEQPA